MYKKMQHNCAHTQSLFPLLYQVLFLSSFNSSVRTKNPTTAGLSASLLGRFIIRNCHFVRACTRSFFFFFPFGSSWVQTELVSFSSFRDSSIRRGFKKKNSLKSLSARHFELERNSINPQNVMSISFRENESECECDCLLKGGASSFASGNRSHDYPN